MEHAGCLCDITVICFTFGLTSRPCVVILFFCGSTPGCGRPKWLLSIGVLSKNMKLLQLLLLPGHVSHRQFPIIIFFWITFLALPAWGLRFSGSEPRVAAAVRQFVQAYRPEGLDEQMLYGVGTCFLFFWVGLGIGAFWEHLVPFLEGVWDTS